MIERVVEPNVNRPPGDAGVGIVLAVGPRNGDRGGSPSVERNVAMATTVAYDGVSLGLGGVLPRLDMATVVYTNTEQVDIYKQGNNNHTESQGRDRKVAL